MGVAWSVKMSEIHRNISGLVPGVVMVSLRMSDVLGCLRVVRVFLRISGIFKTFGDIGSCHGVIEGINRTLYR